MPNIKIDDSRGLMTREERKELEGFFNRFTEALDSPDEKSMFDFFAREETFLSEVSDTQRMMIALVFKQLEIVDDNEANAFAQGDFEAFDDLIEVSG